MEGNLIATLQEGYSTERPIRDRFIYLGTTLFRYHIEHPLQFRFIQQYHNSPYGAALRRDRFLGKTVGSNIFIELMEQGMAQQVLKDLPLMAISAIAFGPLFVLARDHILGFIVADHTLIEQVVAACWEGIRR